MKNGKLTKKTNIKECEVYYLHYLNKDNNFMPSIMEFVGVGAREKLVEWAKANLDNYHPDMIHTRYLNI
jgi:hypothetical protein